MFTPDEHELNRAKAERMIREGHVNTCPECGSPIIGRAMNFECHVNWCRRIKKTGGKPIV